MNKLSDLELGWLAGLLEGDGHFYAGWVGPDRSYLRIHVACEMADEDTIRRLHAVTGIGNVAKRRGKRNPKWRLMWQWTVSKRADVVPLMEYLLPHMSQRRAAVIRDALDEHRRNPLKKGPVRHGTMSMYVSRRCRCADCRSAASAYWKDLKARKDAAACGLDCSEREGETK